MMQHNDKYSELIKNRLSTEIQEILSIAGKIAKEQDQKLYIVGGMVRDLLLECSSPDLDLVVEGNAVDIANRFAETVGGKVTVHPRFRTATVKWDGKNVDFVTARSEIYSRPGALPTVKPGSIDDDLFRRDFTINSLAADLSSGNLIDPFNGRGDIDTGLIRILHEKSFIDDATRIWRAIRYEQRLNFTLEPDTLKLLKRDLDMLGTISRDRIRHELELVLKEDQPEKSILRADELGVIEKLHPSLAGDDWVSEKFKKAREIVSPTPPSPELYLAILAYRLNEDETEELITRLVLRKLQTRTLRDVCQLKNRLEKLSEYDIRPSEIYYLLHGLSRIALLAVAIAADSPTAQKNIGLYLDKLRYVRTVLTGKDLGKMGIKSGPGMKEILWKLLQAHLDGQVIDKQGEVKLVHKITHQ
ncbi:MAG: CCA tRNA nucleotidyltransferase [Dehalococcoidales bacterium]|nr:MAG: CCA tRNA nucleotidyltransferase [Dehalococcoidales bacterium]